MTPAEIARMNRLRNGPIEPDETRVNAILGSLDRWRDGPRPPAPERFSATIVLLIERLEALDIGDDEWDELGID
jgi:hypothetical protein